ncbi:hypothetical protein Sste5346_009660 [Sporothrix stenoceras]|uniref:LysM domain-containing protein n=1 Tax=Sporothrix stenoceras TaxID=5173 RepID=A0ABR3YKA4_9PEZI
MTLLSVLAVALLSAAPLTGAVAVPSVDDISLTARVANAPSPLQPGTDHDCLRYHKAVSGDTCAKIANETHVSLSNFYAWNKGINHQCGNLMAGYYVCTQERVVKTRAANAPSPIQPGTVHNCHKYHKVKSGDTCSKIAKGAHVKLSEFMDWNTRVNKKCTNLLSGYYVCVNAGETDGEHKGEGGGGEGGKGGKKQRDVEAVEAVDAVDAVGAADSADSANSVDSVDTTNASGSPTPLQPGTAKNCRTYHRVKSGDTCAKIAKSARVSLKQFYSWNKGIHSSCNNLEVNYYVCTARGKVSAPHPHPNNVQEANNNGVENDKRDADTIDIAATPSPLLPGTSSNCGGYHKVTAGETCDSIRKHTDLSASLFFKVNSGLHANCDNLWAGYYVCVTPPAPAPPTVRSVEAVDAAEDDIPGTAYGCAGYRKIVAGDTCDSVRNATHMTPGLFFHWNSGLYSTCDYLWVGYYVCVQGPGWKMRRSVEDDAT